MAKIYLFQKLGTKISAEERLNIHISIFTSISNLEDPSIDDVVFEDFKTKQYEGQALSLLKSSFIILNKDIRKDKETDKNTIIDIINLYGEIEKQIYNLHQPLNLKIKDLEVKKEEFLVRKRKEYTSTDPDPLDLPGQYSPLPEAAYMSFELFVYHDLIKEDSNIIKWNRRLLFLIGCDIEVKKAIAELKCLMKRYPEKDKMEKYKIQNNEDFVPKLMWNLDKVDLYEIIHSLCQLEAFTIPNSSKKPTKKYVKEAFEKFFMVDLTNLYSHTTHAKDRGKNEIFLDEMKSALNKHFNNLNEKRSELK